MPSVVVETRDGSSERVVALTLLPLACYVCRVLTHVSNVGTAYKTNERGKEGNKAKDRRPERDGMRWRRESMSRRSYCGLVTLVLRHLLHGPSAGEPRATAGVAAASRGPPASVIVVSHISKTQDKVEEREVGLSNPSNWVVTTRA
jgi:hypothetical protein